MARIGTRAEVWFSNVIASFARYVAERTLPESVPMLMRPRCRRGFFQLRQRKYEGCILVSGSI